MDDIFKTIKLISNYLPKKKLLTIYTKNLKNNNFIQSDVKIQNNIPPFNQSSMDGIAKTNISKKFKIVWSS